MTKVERLLGEYRESHQNRTNQFIHNIFVPLIYLSVIGMLWEVKFPIGLDFLGGEPLNAAMIAILLVFAYYLNLSFSVSVGILAVSSIGLATCYFFDDQLPVRIGMVSLGIFVVSWIMQFVGHKVEGKKPSFLKDIEFFLVGPMWVLVKCYHKLGIKY